MFKIIAAPLVWWPVTFPGVSEDGEIVENRIEMRFRILTEDDHRDYLKRASLLTELEVGDDAVSAGSETAAKLVGEIAADWRGVGAANGEPLKFEPDHLRQLMNVPNAFLGVMRAYAACRAGRAEARAGN